MTSDDNVVYLGRTAPPGESVYHRLRQLAHRRLPALLRHMMDNVDDALFARAERAETAALQTQYFDAMRQVRLRRSEVEEGFRRELVAGFRTAAGADASRRAPRAAGEVDDDELELIGQEALEENIALRDMSAKARARYALPLNDLNCRVRELLGAPELAEDLLPLDPKALVSAFARAAEVLELEIQARLLVYKLFDRYVMAQLPGFYEESNRLLIDAGVLPKIKRSPPAKPAPSRPQPPRRHAPRPQTPGLQKPAAAPQPPADMFGVLSQLLGDQKYQGEAGRWTGTGYSGLQPPASAGDVVAALSSLQRQELGGDPLGEAQLKQLLQSALAEAAGQTRALGRPEDDTIDIVSMLFDVILDDPNLPAALKALIARLQIPVLKVALLDRAFFDRFDHPARVLINELARAAVSWSGSAAPAEDPLYRKVSELVQRVVRDFAEDVGLFAEVLEDFRGFLRRERERASRVEARTRQAAEGKAKVEYARQRVREELQQRRDARELPGVVHRLIDQAWTKVLFITYLREGEQSADWQRQLRTVDRLIWSVAPKGGAEERKQLLAEIPHLLHELREGLNGILFSPLEMTRLFKQLEQEHIRCLRQLAAPGAVAEPEPPQATAAPEQEPGGAEAEDGLDEYRRELEQVQIGTWFEFRMDGRAPVRGKLSARLAGGQRLVFVNRAGFKLAERSLRDLARDLQQGTVDILDDNMLFDRALEAVVMNLRQMRDGQ